MSVTALADVEPPTEDGPTIPHDLRAEMSVIGGLLLSPAALDDVSAAMRPEDHWRPAHQLIHAAVIALSGAGRAIDVITVAEAMAQSGTLTRAGGQAYLHQCIQAVPTAANAGYYAELVAKKATLRRLVEAGTRIVQLGYSDQAGDIDDVVSAAGMEVQAVADGRLADDEVPHEQAVYDAIDSLDRPLGPPTPWRALSDVLAGWAPSWLYVVGARPGVGKTALGVDVAVDLARRQLLPVVFSMEMPRHELYLRMLSHVGSVDGQRMLRRAMHLDEEQRLAKAAADISRMPMLIDDRSNLSLAQIRARVRQAQRKSEVGAVVIDYLNLIRPPAEAARADRRVQVDAIAQGLKNLARDLKVPVIALAQLNRGIEGRADKMPSMSDLRESGGIEAAADVVMLMHRDFAADPNTLHLVLPKNRHGPLARLELDFVGQFSRIEDRPWEPRGIA